jgi:hypothetical protein
MAMSSITSGNQPLSERRAQLARNFLIEQGIPEANLETQAYGKEKNLTADEVKQLVDQSTDLTPEARKKLKDSTIVLAYNRRVDLNLAAGPESTREYPYKAEDFPSLIDRNGPQKVADVKIAGHE